MRDRKWFPVKPAALARAQDWYQRYGRWTLLLSWVPIVGDPLTVAAGIMRERLVIFVALVTVAKAGRYLVVAAIVLHWFAPWPLSHASRPTCERNPNRSGFGLNSAAAIDRRASPRVAAN